MTAKVSEFGIELPAKWVLTGEHSVLRGRQALAFPFQRFTLKLTYREQDTFSITPNPFQSQIRRLIERALEFLKVPGNAFPSGEVEITSAIPIGAGLGSSAALCAAIARLVLWKTRSDISLWIPLATYLEDFFHGKSSGMDVNVIIHGTPVMFSISGGAAPMDRVRSMPSFEWYDSGFRGNTRDCIERVLHWQKQNPHLKESYDDRMQEAGVLARSGLEAFQTNREEGENKIKMAMELAQDCFEQWGLVTPELLTQKFDLLRQGALAVKLTGAGLGGFWVALWPASRPRLDKGI
jgi:mevalonate kinase